MNYIAHLSSFLILCGAMLMLVNIVLYRQTIKRANHTSPEPSSVTKSLSRLHLLLMCFFLASYLAVLYFFVSEVEFASSLFVSVIFFFGAVFVFLGIIVQRRMISTLHSFNKSLEESNNRLQKEQQALLLVNARLESEVETRIQAEESNQLKSNLLSLVSHELRTPLTSIYGFTKLLQKGVSSLSPDEECASYNNKKERIENNISIICSECSRLTRLINNFLDLARIESGKTDWHDSRHSLSELIDGAISVVEGILLDKPSVSLKKNVPDNLPELFVDSDRLSQVLINILNNAVKFTDFGVVELSAKRLGETVRIAIRDEGVGIPEKDLPNIFDKFYIVRSGDTLGGNQAGTGLGLPICKQIVEHYDGRIWVESELGVGTTFFIELPVN